MKEKIIKTDNSEIMIVMKKRLKFFINLFIQLINDWITIAIIKIRIQINLHIITMRDDSGSY